MNISMNDYGKKSSWVTQGVFSLSVAFACSGTTAAAQAPEKTAGEARKNVQVLKELPNSQIPAVMSYMMASVGAANCEYCHVRSGQNFEYDKDDKQKKKTARKMIQMVIDINKTSFEGKNEVTCYSCHQGREKPHAEPPIGLTAAAREAAAPGAQEPQPVAAKLIDKYIESIGGKQAIEKIKSRALTGNIVMPDGRNVPIEIYHQGPDKFASVVGGSQGEVKQAIDGAAGWTKDNRGLRETSGEELAAQARVASVYGVLQVKEPFTRLRYGGKERIAERDAHIVRVPPVAGRSERLYFDAETGLLLRRILLTATVVGQLPEQFDFEDYREVDGVKVPFTIRRSNLNPRGATTQKFTRIQANVPAEEKFNKPAAQ